MSQAFLIIDFLKSNSTLNHIIDLDDACLFFTG
jgi:hypothetical protein